MLNVPCRYSILFTTRKTLINEPPHVKTNIGENKGADQLRSNREADLRLCFRYSDSTIPPLLKSEISSF